MIHKLRFMTECDECGDFEFVPWPRDTMSLDIARLRVRAEFRKQGWRYDGIDDHDICPNCMEGEQ